MIANGFASYILCIYTVYVYTVYIKCKTTQLFNILWQYFKMTEFTFKILLYNQFFIQISKIKNI